MVLNEDQKRAAAAVKAAMDCLLYTSKISNELWNEVRERPDGKLVLVTAINPTPARCV